MHSCAAVGALYRTQLRKALAYRGQAVLFVLTALFPLVLMAGWLAVIAEVGPVQGFTSGRMSSYFVAATLVNHFTRTWLVWDWEQELRTGGVAAQMLLPVHPFLHFLADHLARATVTSIFVLPAVLGLLALVPGLAFSANLWDVGCAVLAVVIGFALNFMIAAIFASLALSMTKVSQIYALWWGAGAFMSGWIAPIDLLPSWLRDFATVAPFHLMIGFPVETLLGMTDGPQVASGLLSGVGWLVVAAIGLSVAWRFGVRNFEIHGQ